MSARYSLNQSKFLLTPEIDYLKEILKRYELSDTRNVYMIELALRTGGRAQEILKIEKAHLSPHDQTVFLYGLKGSNNREIPLEKAFFERFYAWALSQASNSIFPVTYDRLYQIWLEFRPVPKKFHSLRHTFAIELFKKTKDLRLVQVALGHRNIMNTMVYADYVYTKNELRRIIA